MEKQGLANRIIIGILKTIWKLFLIVLWGFLRLTEVLAGQLAQLFKKNVN